jgi:cytochrome bd-type quinol oxidase subunit 2
MIHPMFKIVASRPELLAEHLAAYGQLAAVQAQAAAGQLQRRAVLGGVAALAAALGAGLAGVAVMLVGAVQLQAMPAPWLLVVVPLVPFVVAAACALRLRGLNEPSALAPLREQFAADAALLREASGP